MYMTAASPEVGQFKIVTYRKPTEKDEILYLQEQIRIVDAEIKMEEQRLLDEQIAKNNKESWSFDFIFNKFISLINFDSCLL